MKPPTGKQIGEEILLEYCPELLQDGKPKLMVFRPFLVPLKAAIPKSVLRDGIRSQLLWIYEVFRKGMTDDPRASLPHTEIINEIIIHLRLPREPPIYFGKEADSLIFWANKKTARANAKGGRARAKKDAQNIAKNFLR